MVNHRRRRRNRRNRPAQAHGQRPARASRADAILRMQAMREIHSQSEETKAKTKITKALNKANRVSLSSRMNLSFLQQHDLRGRLNPSDPEFRSSLSTYLKGSAYNMWTKYPYDEIVTASVDVYVEYVFLVLDVDPSEAESDDIDLFYDENLAKAAYP